MAGPDFQNEVEVKEFLDQIGTEYRFGCYSEKNPEGEPFVVVQCFGEGGT